MLYLYIMLKCTFTKNETLRAWNSFQERLEMNIAENGV